MSISSKNRLPKPVWRKRNRVVCLPGIPSSYSDLCAEVDAAIADFIFSLNKAGLETTYCCSAMNVDHRDRLHLSGYIAFKHRIPLGFASLLGEYLEGTSVIRINRKSEHQMRAAWNFVRNTYSTWYRSL